MRLKTLEDHLRATWQSALAGDAASYASLLHEISAHLRVFLRRRLHTNSPDVEDLVQEVLLAIHQKRHTYQSDQPLTAWVYAIARYKLIDHLRANQQHHNRHEDIDDWIDQLWTPDTTHASGLKNDLNFMLADLPDKQRLPIEHTKLNGLSVAETAKLTGQTEAAIKVNVHRGLKALIKTFGGSA